MNWLIFLAQLPTTPSSLRVAVWRKMRAAGALGIQNGIWMLPERPEQESFLENLLDTIQQQGASGQIFKVNPLSEAIEKDIIDRFQADRDEEYIEFCERCEEFLAEIKKETAKEKFSFAELEENEQDFLKLGNWLKTIQKRDFSGAKRGKEAVQFFTNVKTVLEIFSAKVYARQGIELTDSANPAAQ